MIPASELVSALHVEFDFLGQFLQSFGFDVNQAALHFITHADGETPTIDDTYDVKKVEPDEILEDKPMIQGRLNI